MATYDNIVTDGLVFHVDAANKISSDVTDVNNMANPTEIGTYTNSASLVNNEFDFDGTDDYINFGNIYDFENNELFTASCWVKTTDSTAQVFGKVTSNGSEGWGIFISGGKLLCFLTASSSVISSTSTMNINDDNWHNLLYTYDGTSAGTGINLYIDGSAASQNQSGTLLTSTLTTSNLILGARNNPSINHPFEGKVAKASIYDKVLTSAEVLQNYESQKHRFE